MPSAYLMGTLTVHDWSWAKEYIPAVTAQILALGGKYHVRSPAKSEKLEGDSPEPTIYIVIEFPSMEVAHDWYHGDDYAPFLKGRLAGATGDLALVEGVE